MKLINFFKEKILKIKPVFKMEIVESWFSEKWFCVRFSNNNGWTWNYIYDCKPDVDSKYDGLELTTYYFSFNKIDNIAEKFNTYDKCIKHNETIINKINETNHLRKKTYQEELVKANEKIKIINENH